MKKLIRGETMFFELKFSYRLSKIEISKGLNIPKVFKLITKNQFSVEKAMKRIYANPLYYKKILQLKMT